MREFDAFHGYPEPKERKVGPGIRTIHNRLIAAERGREFYDGDRANGYGGMVDDGRWGPIASDLINDYNLGPGCRVLQVNAHKGFLLNELYKRGMRVWGTEVSEYAASLSLIPIELAPFTALPYEGGFFDLVIAASPVYTLILSDAVTCLKEIQRVGKGKSFVTLAAIENEEDVQSLQMLRWWFVFTDTILTKSDWIEVMKYAGYTGDYRFETAQSLRLAR